MAVIDGNQRLNSIKLFLANDFELRGLTAYPELEGYRFSYIDPRFQRHIQNRTIRCIVILKDTHPQIKFDVFERLNTGSVKLNSHELRHGIHSGPLMEKLEVLGNNDLFKELTLNKNDKRMKSDELVLRFFALMENWRNYTKPLVSFLNNYSETNRNADSQKLSELKNDFISTLAQVNFVLNKYAFKTYDKSLKNTKFNAALYDAQMIAFFELNLSEVKLDYLNKLNFIQKNQEFISDEDFNKHISSGTTDRNSIINRINEYKQFVNSLL